MIRHRLFVLAALGWLSLPVQAALSPEQKRSLPPPVGRPVDFAKDIQPLLQNSCAQCHGRGKDKGGFRIDTRETFLQGGDAGPGAVAGRSADSLVIELVSGLDPDNLMPQKGRRLTAEQVGLLRGWIDQGLPWPKEITFARQPIENLRPQQPPIPPASRQAGEHPVDRLLQPYYERHKVGKAPPVEDRLFARRVYLDVIGLLPPPEELEAFARERAPDKRERLVHRLLANNHRYAEHWLSFWNDLLRNDYKGTGYIDGGRKQITAWLYRALATNQPYDRMVAQLINPPPEAEGFLKGIVWRGAVNSSQTPAMQAAQNLSQVFMGVNLKCASCHDSFINDYTLADTYALANVFSDEPLELFQCDKPTGIKAETRFFYPGFGVISASAKRPERLRQLSEIITSKDNGRLSRTVVNRLWARFFGRGLVEPVDEMDGPAWHPDLLNWLAEDLVAHGYNLKHTIATILTSRAYQRPAVPGGEGPEAHYVFHGPLVRRLTAEQFRDALTSLTGAGYAQPAAQVDWLAGQPESVRQTLLRQAAPLVVSEATEVPTNHWLTWFGRELSLTGRIERAAAVVAASDVFTVFVNGQAVGGSRKAKEPAHLDLHKHLREGINQVVLQIGAKPGAEAIKGKDGKKAAPPPKLLPKGFAGFFEIQAGGRTVSFHADDAWRYATGNEDTKPDLSRTAAWAAVPESAGGGPAAGLDARAVAAAIFQRSEMGRVRAAWVAADPLAMALGRPNREQVCTVRPTQATTLQALELTNGGTLAAVLRAGAEKLLANHPTGNRRLVEVIFQRGLGRPATAGEIALAAPLVGEPVRAEGIEDLLWSVAMLPEFQLIY